MIRENPRGWVMTTLETVAVWGSGGTPSRKNPEFFLGKIPWIKTGELGEKYVKAAEEHISEEAVKRSSAKVFPKGSVGIAMYGATIGKVSIWGIDASTNQACAVAQPISYIISNEFLYYFLLSEKQNFVNAGKGGAQPNISQDILKKWQIPLPPINEQKRIVAKIEELFSELDNGLKSLKTALEQLKVYRQAVLKHAFEGKLTTLWREKNKDYLETPEQLLEQVQQAREAYHYKMKKEGKVNGNQLKPIKPALFEILPSVDQSNLPPGWFWSTFDECGDWVGGGTPSKSHQEFWDNGDILWVSPKDMKTKNITDTIQKITRTGVENSSAKIIENDSVLFVVRSGILRRILPVATAHASITVNQDMKALIPYFHDVHFLYWYSIANEYQIRHQCSKNGTTVESIEFGELKKFRCPVTSLKEQKEVVREIERMMSVIENLELIIEEALSESESLRQSILKKAFAGKLVAQDANDEPASVLLERIRAEKESYLANNKPKHQKDVNSDNEYVQDYLIEEASV